MWGGITETETGRDFPLHGTQTLDKYIQPDEWQTQEFPVREDFTPRDYRSHRITQTGEPEIFDEWEWNKW